MLQALSTLRSRDSLTGELRNRSGPLFLDTVKSHCVYNECYLRLNRTHLLFLLYGHHLRQSYFPFFLSVWCNHLLVRGHFNNGNYWTTFLDTCLSKKKRQSFSRPREAHFRDQSLMQRWHGQYVTLLQTSTARKTEPKTHGILLPSDIMMRPALMTKSIANVHAFTKENIVTLGPLMIANGW